jgi:hypothetical protein
MEHTSCGLESSRAIRLSAEHEQAVSRLGPRDMAAVHIQRDVQTVS